MKPKERVAALRLKLDRVDKALDKPDTHQAWLEVGAVVAAANKLMQRLNEKRLAEERIGHNNE